MTLQLGGNYRVENNTVLRIPTNSCHSAPIRLPCHPSTESTIQLVFTPSTPIPNLHTLHSGQSDRLSKENRKTPKSLKAQLLSFFEFLFLGTKESGRREKSAFVRMRVVTFWSRGNVTMRLFIGCFFFWISLELGRDLCGWCLIINLVNNVFTPSRDFLVCIISTYLLRIYSRVFVFHLESRYILENIFN